MWIIRLPPLQILRMFLFTWSVNCFTAFFRSSACSCILSLSANLTVISLISSVVLRTWYSMLSISIAVVVMSATAKLLYFPATKNQRIPSDGRGWGRSVHDFSRNYRGIFPIISSFICFVRMVKNSTKLISLNLNGTIEFTFFLTDIIKMSPVHCFWSSSDSDRSLRLIALTVGVWSWDWSRGKSTFASHCANGGCCRGVWVGLRLLLLLLFELAHDGIDLSLCYVVRL